MAETFDDNEVLMLDDKGALVSKHKTHVYNLGDDKIVGLGEMAKIFLGDIKICSKNKDYISWFDHDEADKQCLKNCQEFDDMIIDWARGGRYVVVGSKDGIELMRCDLPREGNFPACRTFGEFKAFADKKEKKYSLTPSKIKLHPDILTIVGHSDRNYSIGFNFDVQRGYLPVLVENKDGKTVAGYYSMKTGKYVVSQSEDSLPSLVEICAKDPTQVENLNPEDVIDMQEDLRDAFANESAKRSPSLLHTPTKPRLLTKKKRETYKTKMEKYAEEYAVREADKAAYDKSVYECFLKPLSKYESDKVLTEARVDAAHDGTIIF